jgi:hypothetical protein
MADILWFLIEACGALSAGRSSQLFMSNRAYCPVCKEVIWLVDPPWKPVKGKCVARKQILDHHSPRPMSVSQVCHFLSSAIYVNFLCKHVSKTGVQTLKNLFNIQ